MGGVLSCGLTHLAVTPLDVAKCNMQVDPVKYKGLSGTISTIMKEEGSSALFKGWLPTLIGYSAQGCFKFGLYEFFKDYYANLAGEEAATKYRGIIWLAGSASAEVFADIALCPMEMVKVKVQTSVPGTFPTELGAAIAAMRADPSTGFPFKVGRIFFISLAFFFSFLSSFASFSCTLFSFFSHMSSPPRSSTFSPSCPCGLARCPTPWPSSTSSRASRSASTR